MCTSYCELASCFVSQIFALIRSQKVHSFHARRWLQPWFTHYYYDDGLFLIVNTRTDHAEKEDKTEISVRSSFKLDILPHLIIPSANIRLQETIGHGKALYCYSSCLSVTIEQLPFRRIWYCLQGLRAKER